MSIEFLESDFDKVGYLVNLLTSKATGLAADSREFEILRHELLSNPKVSPLLPQWLKQHRNLETFWGFIKQKFNTYAERRTYISEEFTQVLDALEFGQQTKQEQKASQSSPPPYSSQSKPKTAARNKRKVFIVHGRDDAAKHEVSRFIEQLGLETIILHEQASAGMTIIEKIEHYSNDADFAIVLYTPCDLGRGVHEPTIKPKNRARQNVVFEHGYLMAKLGRKNVCPLVKGDIETPNDVSGVVYVTLDQFGGWKAEVSKELIACGYEINSQI